MTSLTDALSDPRRVDTVVTDCVLLLEEEVATKKGISGIGIKTGFKAVRSAKPGFLAAVIHHLLPEFTAALDPVYQEALAKGTSITPYFEQNAGRIADDLLAITDRKAQASHNRILQGAYSKLRGIAKKHVEHAVPRLARLVEKHAGTPSDPTSQPGDHSPT